MISIGAPDFDQRLVGHESSRTSSRASPSGRGAIDEIDAMGKIAAERRLGVSADELADDVGVLDRRLESRTDQQRAVAPGADERRFVARVDADQPRAVRLGQLRRQAQPVGRVLAGVEIDQNVFVSHLPAPRSPRLLTNAPGAQAFLLSAFRRAGASSVADRGGVGRRGRRKDR